MIKAAVAQASASTISFDTEKYLTDAHQCIEMLFKYYLVVVTPNGWADMLDKDGAAISEKMPASTFYHLFCAAVEVSELAEQYI